MFMRGLKRLFRIVPLVFALLCVGPAAWGQAPKQWRESGNFGLRGAVHTVWEQSKALNPDPRTGQPRGGSDRTNWMEFDDHGSLLLQTTDAATAKDAPKIHSEYDAQGQIVVKVAWAADGVTPIRQEYTYGPYGAVETRWYAGKTFTGRTTVEYDKAGNFVRDNSYDAEGRLQHQSVINRDGRTGTVEEQGLDADGHSIIHVADRFDEKSGIYEHQNLDAKGQVMNILRLHNGEFVSWWLSPDFHCAEGQTDEGIFNWNEAERRFQIYFTLKCPRTLEITLLHHSGKEGNIENDDEERYLEDGTRLERTEYQYVRDAHKNWTKRVALVWDTKIDKMVPVQEDHRAISYYGEEKAE